MKLDFYVLRNDAVYNLIFGCTLLETIKAVYNLHTHRLRYTTPGGSVTITTVPWPQVKREPVMQEVRCQLTTDSATQLP